MEGCQMTKRYPRLTIKYQQIVENTRVVNELCKARGIAVTGVVKGFNGLPEVAMALDEGAASIWAVPGSGSSKTSRPGIL